ncbi:hypothetical protein BV25DRAFT_1919699 [Artomyces pyxidatus]|uniref:Uncharacterized protein n=1 Tax=Artomyces pyxidatus TaxID=48021 RepID=A0ACB8SP27_9AGAM|nr:hypothetical protein BV25DRAFT_1919699 [Artomyces pyxidatus]
MRLSLALLATVATTISASSLRRRSSATTYPDCAIPCLENADLGSCAFTDLTCLCNSPSFIDSTTVCIYGACSGADLAQANAAAQEACATVSVALTSTPAAVLQSAVPTAT